ncbi:MAG TPA: hypothetical protein VEH04_14320 [Verrucomicrobiae bacterium]|nr:hypothetical protein [Verrucomicrobiae bacterium]
MKFTRFFPRLTAVAAGLVLSFSLAAPAAEPTALELIKEANRHVGDEVKDKVVQIRSEKSIAGLTPNIWFVVFYDKDARFKTAEVKLGAGKKLEVKHPMRQPFAYMNYKNVMDVPKLEIDSDDAIKIATKEPLLDKLTIRATQLSLERKDDIPIWRVRLWAQKLRNASKDADIGQVHINALDGTVIESDLHIDRVD